MQQSEFKIYSEIDSCRICSSTVLEDVLDLGCQPPANSLRNNLIDQLPSAPLKLVQCGHCSAVQLTATVSPTYLFSQYLWVSATSSTARNYSETFCSEVLNRAETKLPFVVEIASNDGTFLKRFKEKDCRILGVDPAKNIANDAIDAGIPTLVEFFDVTVAKKILKEHQRPNVVIARNVIPHVKEIHSIAEGISTLVDADGIVVIEFHYAKKIVEELHYDSIYHEHLFYFSLKSLSVLFGQYNLYPFDAFISPISGGSLVLFFKNRKLETSPALTRLLEIEVQSGLNDLNIWQQFGENSKKHAIELKGIVSSYAMDSTLVAYGASARSSTLLNFAGISNQDIEFIIDRNPLKHAMLTPGTDIPIVSYDQAQKMLAGKNLLLLAWNFEYEVVDDLRSNGFKGDIIVPLPNRIHIR